MRSPATHDLSRALLALVLLCTSAACEEMDWKETARRRIEAIAEKLTTLGGKPHSYVSDDSASVSAQIGERVAGGEELAIEVEIERDPARATEKFEEEESGYWSQYGASEALGLGDRGKLHVRMDVARGDSGCSPEGAALGEALIGDLRVRVMCARVGKTFSEDGTAPSTDNEAEELMRAAAERVRALIREIAGIGPKEGDDAANLREAVRRLLRGGTQVAGLTGDSDSDEERIAADLKRIVDASRDHPAELETILVDFLKDAELGRAVYPLLTGRTTGVRQALEMGDRVVLDHLAKALPADAYLLRYVRARERLEQADRQALLRDLHRLANTTGAFLIAALDLGSMLAGFPGPSAVLTQADQFQKLTSPKSEVRKGVLAGDDVPKQVLNFLGALPSPSDVSWLQAGWTLCSTWAGQENNLPPAFPAIDPDIQAALDEGRKQSEYVWFERMNAAFTGLSYEFRRTTVLIAQVDRHLKDRGWTRALPGGMPNELRDFVTVGNHIEPWLKPAAAQIIATGYYSGYAFAPPAAPPEKK